METEVATNADELSLHERRSLMAHVWSEKRPAGWRGSMNDWSVSCVPHGEDQDVVKGQRKVRRCEMRRE